ncbi:hypothetical protein OAB00_02280 [Akkermansiaceae bacterium]|nr:hypothetical protein [Akkermansiaceae bacterium]
MLRYFANLGTTKLVLWCYLVWYVAIVSLYFDSSLNLWLSSAGIAVLIGYALVLAASQKGKSNDKWVIFRLYMFPFFVSSYSSIIKGKGFFLLFPSEMKSLAIAIGACVAMVAFVYTCRLLIKKS